MWVRTWNFVLNILLFLYSKPMPRFFEIVIINFWRCQHKAEFSEEVVSVWSIPDFSPWVSQILWLWRDVRSRARIFLDRLGLHLLLIMESELMPSDCVVRVTTKLRSGKITYKTYKERFPCFSMSDYLLTMLLMTNAVAAYIDLWLSWSLACKPSCNCFCLGMHHLG